MSLAAGSRFAGVIDVWRVSELKIMEERSMRIVMTNGGHPDTKKETGTKKGTRKPKTSGK